MQRQFQLELFKFDQDDSKISKREKYRPKFFSLVRVHEKAISMVIIFLIVSLVSFSLGVEKGKGLATKQPEQREEKKFFAELTKERVDEPKGRIAEDSTEEKQSLKEEEKKKDISKYTVQVATFKTETYAQKEAERLKKKGHLALIVPSGTYLTVCVGNFSEKQKARISLNQLKETYRDCFIRRL